MPNKTIDAAGTKKITQRRFTASVDSDTYERAQYWAKKQNMSLNELLRNAIDMYLAHQVKDYDLPPLEIQRLNQLVDALATLSSNVNTLEQVVVSGFDTLLSLTRGDSYLDDDGELDEDSDLDF